MPAFDRTRLNGSNFAFQHVRPERFLDAMVELELPEIELWGIAPHLHVPTATSADVIRLRRALDERGLSVVCLTPEQVMYPVNIAAADDGLRTSSIAMFRRGAEIAAELDSPLLFVTSGRGYEQEPADAAWRRAADALGEIAEYAAGLGVGCVLEALQRAESNLVTTSADIARMLADIGSGDVGAVLDTVAMAVAGETVDDYFDTSGARIRHVHLVDGTPAGHLAWGDGDLPLAEYVHRLRARGFAGRVTFELFGNGEYTLDPVPALRSCLAAFEAALPPEPGGSGRRGEAGVVTG